jgi:hypothetical protein
MTEKNEATQLSSGRPQPGPPCPKCRMPARFLTSVLDVGRDRQVLVYRCDTCHEEIWR